MRFGELRCAHQYPVSEYQAEPADDWHLLKSPRVVICSDNNLCENPSIGRRVLKFCTGMASIAILLAVLGMPSDSISAVTKCPSIDAKAHQSSDDSGAATESGGSCTISIAGASATSSQPHARLMRNIGLCARRNVLRNVRPEVIAEAVVPALLISSIPQASNLNFENYQRLPPVLQRNGCSNFMSQIGHSGFRITGGPLGQMNFGEIRDCIRSMSSFRNCRITRTHRIIYISTSIGRHRIFISK